MPCGTGRWLWWANTALSDGALVYVVMPSYWFSRSLSWHLSPHLLLISMRRLLVLEFLSLGIQKTWTEQDCCQWSCNSLVFDLLACSPSLVINSLNTLNTPSSRTALYQWCSPDQLGFSSQVEHQGSDGTLHQWGSQWCSWINPGECWEWLGTSCKSFCWSKHNFQHYCRPWWRGWGDLSGV